MSTLETTTSGRRVAARNAAERRKKLILVGLMVAFAVLLAIQLPKLLKGSGSSSSTAAPTATATATPAAVAAGTRSLAASSLTARSVRAIHRMSARDPFVPLIRESTTSPSDSASTGAGTAGLSTVRFTARAAAMHAKPLHVRPTAPIAAVIWTNSQRQVVGLSQVFKVGDAPFRLVGVTPKAMRIEVVGGKFADAKHAISVRKGHRVKLVNTATGVAYRLLYTRGTTNAPSPSIALASTTPGKN